MTSFNLNFLLTGLVYKYSHIGGKGFNIRIWEYAIQSIACSVLEEGGLRGRPTCQDGVFRCGPAIEDKGTSWN